MIIFVAMEYCEATIKCRSADSKTVAIMKIPRIIQVSIFCISFKAEIISLLSSSSIAITYLSSESFMVTKVN